VQREGEVLGVLFPSLIHYLSFLPYAFLLLDMYVCRAGNRTSCIIIIIIFVVKLARNLHLQIFVAFLIALTVFIACE